MSNNIVSVPSVSPSELAGPPQAAAVDLVSLLNGVLRHWKVIAASFLVALVATYGALKLVPSYYKSTVEILIFDPERQIDEAVQKPISPFVDAINDVAMNTEIEVLKSKSIALRVARDLGLDNDPEFQSHSRLGQLTEWFGLSGPNRPDGIPQTAGDPDKARAQALDQAAGALLQRLQVERVPFSYILTISATSQNPLKAQRLAATVADDYLASQREARQEALQRVATWLKGRVDDLQSRVLDTESKIEKLKAESGINDTGFNNVSDQQVTELSTQLMNARGEVAEKKAHLEQARRVIDGNGDVQGIPELMASAGISHLIQQQAELGARAAELSSRLGEGHAQVIALRAQLAGINKQMTVEADRFLDNMQNAYNSAVLQQQSLETSLQRLTAARGNSETYIKLQQLRRVADTDRKLYESYLSQYNEISQRRTLQDASARIIAPAGLPDTPSSPRRKLLYGLAGFFGLGCGVLLAFVIEYRQSGIKTGAQAEQSFGYPVVGVIPSLQSRNLRPAAYDRLLHSLIDAPLSHFSESIRAMRIGLELARPDQVPKVLLITSALPAEGKSTAAMLLAASSASAGHRTVLIDCDLRQQTLSRVFGRKQPGLSEMLRGTAELMDVISKDPATKAYVIPAGSLVPNPADLLMSQRMRDLTAQLRAEFDYVVIDASPLLPVVDALALATLADKILVIVEWNRTPRASVSEAFRVLRPEAARIGGVVLNKVDLKQLDSYGYRRSYNYRAFENISPERDRLK